MNIRQIAAVVAVASATVMTGGLAASASPVPVPVPSASPGPSTSPSASPSVPPGTPAVAPATLGPGSFENLCLANSNTWCASMDPVEIYMAVITTPAALKVIFDWISQIRESGAPAGPEGEEQSQGDDGNNSEGSESTGLCLADTGGAAFMTSCGANGTVWIAVSHGDGYWLVSRYMWNTHGVEEVLTAPLDQNAALFTEFPSSAWQTWGWYGAPAGACCEY
jgi:hypothetical protein